MGIKKLTYIFFFLMTPLLAQVSPNTITVSGEVRRKVEIQEYNVIVILSEIKSGNYQKLEEKSIHEIIQKFCQKLDLIDVSFKDFKVNVPYELRSISEKKKTLVYNYSTSSIEKIRGLVKISLNGVTIASVDVVAKNLSVDEIVNLSNIAIENAQVLASKIAEIQGKKIGKITQILNLNKSTQSMSTYAPDESQVYSVTVSFELL